MVLFFTKKILPVLLVAVIDGLAAISLSTIRTDDVLLFHCAGEIPRHHLLFMVFQKKLNIGKIRQKLSVV